MNRLLIVTELFFTSLGGQEIRYLELGKLMIEYRWSVDVVAIGKGGCADEETVAGIRVHRLIQAEGYQRTHLRLRSCKQALRPLLKIREERREKLLKILGPPNSSHATATRRTITLLSRLIVRKERRAGVVVSVKHSSNHASLS
jgi:hypothetical protein